MVARTGATVAYPIEGVRLKGNWGASRSVRRAPSWRLLIRRYRGRRRCLWLGGLSPAKALAKGRATFRGLPFSSLTAADLASNSGTGLNTRAVPLALGKCDAFMSHSWHDDDDAKWAALDAWAARFEAEHKHSPMLWLDKVTRTCPIRTRPPNL